MADDDQIRRTAGMAKDFSYWFMLLILVAVVWLHLAAVLLAGLFTYLALTRLKFLKRGGKWLSVAIFLVLVAGIAYGLGYFVHQTIRALPEIADKAIPSIIQTAKDKGIELPFTDYDSLKDLALDTVGNGVRYLGSVAKVARGAGTQFLFLVVGCVVGISLFLNPRFELGRDSTGPREDLYSRCCEEIARRFGAFYGSFVTVMGAQIIISGINTALTAAFVAAVQLPYAAVVVGVTFLCGLVPVVGNLISNTIVVGIGFTISPKTAMAALVFLVAIHKLEYFLNSKIVGWRIHNPLWLTLLGLVIGERILGVPGMILAPVVLNYIRLETSDVPGRSCH
jgi:predicted PurR-regulated permease PerM